MVQIRSSGSSPTGLHRASLWAAPWCQSPVRLNKVLHRQLKEVQTCEIAAVVHSPLSGSKVLPGGFKPALLAPVSLPSSSESPASAFTAVAVLRSPMVLLFPLEPCSIQRFISAMHGPELGAPWSTLCPGRTLGGCGKAAWLGDSKLAAVLTRKSDSLFQYEVVCWQIFWRSKTFLEMFTTLAINPNDVFLVVFFSVSLPFPFLHWHYLWNWFLHLVPTFAIPPVRVDCKHCSPCPAGCILKAFLLSARVCAGVCWPKVKTSGFTLKDTIWTWFGVWQIVTLFMGTLWVG